MPISVALHKHVKWKERVWIGTISCQQDSLTSCGSQRIHQYVTWNAQPTERFRINHRLNCGNRKICYVRHLPNHDILSHSVLLSNCQAGVFFLCTHQHELQYAHCRLLNPRRLGKEISIAPFSTFLHFQNPYPSYRLRKAEISHEIPGIRGRAAICMLPFRQNAAALICNMRQFLFFSMMQHLPETLLQEGWKALRHPNE